MANFTLGLHSGQANAVYTQQGKEWTIRSSVNPESIAATFRSYRGFKIVTPLENVSITYEELAKALGGLKDAIAQMIQVYLEDKDKDDMHFLYPAAFAQGLSRRYPAPSNAPSAIDIFHVVNGIEKKWDGHWVETPMTDNMTHAGKTFEGIIYYPTEKADEEIHLSGEELVAMAAYLTETDMDFDDEDACCFAVAMTSMQ